VVGGRPLPLRLRRIGPRAHPRFRQVSSIVWRRTDETGAVGAPPPATPGRTFSPCPYWDAMRMVLYSYGSWSMV